MYSFKLFSNDLWFCCLRFITQNVSKLSATLSMLNLKRNKKSKVHRKYFNTHFGRKLNIQANTFSFCLPTQINTLLKKKQKKWLKKSLTKLRFSGKFQKIHKSLYKKKEVLAKRNILKGLSRLPYLEVKICLLGMIKIFTRLKSLVTCYNEINF